MGEYVRIGLFQGQSESAFQHVWLRMPHFAKGILHFKTKFSCDLRKSTGFFFSVGLKTRSLRIVMEYGIFRMKLQRKEQPSAFCVWMMSRLAVFTIVYVKF